MASHVPSPLPRVERFDPAGQLLAALGLGAVVAALVESSGQGWTIVIVSVLVFGMGLLSAFAFVERARERRGRPVMLPPSLVAPVQMRAALAAAGIYNFSLYGMLIAFSIAFQYQRHYSPLQAGLAFLPLTVVGAFTSAVVAGRLVVRFGTRPILGAGMACSAAGSVILAFYGPQAGYWLAAAGFAVFGAGTGLSAPAMTAAVLDTAPAERASRASGALNAARQLGGVVGVALLGSITASDPARLPVALAVAAAAFALGAAVSLRSGGRTCRPPLCPRGTCRPCGQ